MQTINSNSFKKLLPNSDQMKEDDDPAQLPCFGQSMASNESMVAPDALDEEVEALLGRPNKIGGDKNVI